MGAGQFDGWSRVGFAFRSGASLTNAFQALALTRDATSAPASGSVPPCALLRQVVFELSSIAGGAASVIYYLARDAAGDRPITRERTATIRTGLTTATRGGAEDYPNIIHINVEESGVDVAGTIYVVARLDAGTATSAIRLYWLA